MWLPQTKEEYHPRSLQQLDQMTCKGPFQLKWLYDSKFAQDHQIQTSIYFLLFCKFLLSIFAGH